MDINELKEEVAEDLRVDESRLAKCASENPALMSKYLNKLLSIKSKYYQAEREYRKVYKERTDYYKGRAPAHVYKEEGPMHVKILNQELPTYLDADEKVQNARLKRDSYKMLVEYLEQVISAIKGRNFDIKNTIEWNKFIAGE